MSDHVLIPVPGLGVLRMTEEALRAALAAGAAFVASTNPASAAPASDPSERLLTAEQAAEITGTKASWWREAARQDRVPVTKIGRYPRFRRADVLAVGTMCKEYEPDSRA